MVVIVAEKPPALEPRAEAIGRESRFPIGETLFSKTEESRDAPFCFAPKLGPQRCNETA